MTVPLVLVVGLLLGGAGSTSPASPSPTAGAPLPVVTVTAPPSSDSATISTCAQVISALPLTLDGQNLARTVSTPSSPSIVAWGNPAIVLRCGVARPKSLVAGSASEFQAGGLTTGPYYDITSGHGANVWTTVDRSVYVEVTVPGKYQGADVLPAVSKAIAGVLPAVCSVDSTETDLSRLCTRRK